MLRNDYVIRLIEQLARAVARILARLERADPEETSREMERALEDLTGVTLPVLRELPLSQLLGAMGIGDEHDAVRLLAAGEALYLDAAVGERSGRDDGVVTRSRFKALALYAKAIPRLGDLVPGEVSDRARRTFERLADWQIPPEMAPDVLGWLEHDGDFARAENLLFDLAGEEPDGPWVAWGRTFYDRLEALPDEALAVGGLARDEIATGRADLEEL
jgi:DNA-binding transcriptional ArsR family regulator